MLSWTLMGQMCATTRRIIEKPYLLRKFLFSTQTKLERFLQNTTFIPFPAVFFSDGHEPKNHTTMNWTAIFKPSITWKCLKELYSKAMYPRPGKKENLKILQPIYQKIKTKIRPGNSSYSKSPDQILIPISAKSDPPHYYSASGDLILVFSCPFGKRA